MRAEPSTIAYMARPISSAGAHFVSSGKDIALAALYEFTPINYSLSNN